MSHPFSTSLLRRARRAGVGMAAAAALLAVLAWSPRAEAQAPPNTLAQTLVESAKALHPQATEIGIELPSANGCHTIASTDPADRGERCESDDIRPLQTGRPAVAKEKDGYDVSLLLHDRTGARVGVVGIEFGLTAYPSSHEALAAARKIERDLARQIPSREALTCPAGTL